MSVHLSVYPSLHLSYPILSPYLCRPSHLSYVSIPSSLSISSIYSLSVFSIKIRIWRRSPHCVVGFLFLLRHLPLLLLRLTPTQIEPELLKVPRLPRKIQRRQIRTNSSPSFHIYEGTESTTPAKQIEPELLKVPRLPRKIQRRQIRTNSSPSFRGLL